MLYVAAVITVGAVCAIGLVRSRRRGRSSSPRSRPEVAIFAVFALVGEFVPLKVFTRGAEGEVTTSTMLRARRDARRAARSPALICLASANLARGRASGRKPVKKIAFNILQYAITVAAAGAVLQATTGLPRAHEPHIVARATCSASCSPRSSSSSSTPCSSRR